MSESIELSARAKRLAHRLVPGLVTVLLVGTGITVAQPGAAQGVPLAIEDMPLAQYGAVKRGGTVTPVYEGWYPQPDGSFMLYFGYYNRNTDDVAPLLPKGTVLVVTSWHDNTAENPTNPDANQWIGWGARTVDEMSIAWFNATHLSRITSRSWSRREKGASRVGGNDSCSCVWKGEASMVLLQPALRSTAFGGGLSCGGPSIPLPRACAREPNTARPGLEGIGG